MIVRHDRQAQTSVQLEEALSSRSVIDQALGILMAQQRCTADEALALLRSHSQNTNRRVRDVAAGLIQRVSGAPAASGTPFVHEDLG
jgi:AmiR/NasT family two-component response regulator